MCLFTWFKTYNIGSLYLYGSTFIPQNANVKKSINSYIRQNQNTFQKVLKFTVVICNQKNVWYVD